MEISIKISWLLIALIHATPSLTLFKPEMIETLYGVQSDGDLKTMLLHRGALFFAVLVVAIFAMFEPNARRAATLIAGISMVGFLLLYAKAGLPDGPLRKIAVADFIGLAPLIWAGWQAFRPTTI
jgi:predicted ABC-type exoprotein transport system permease subunit